MKPTPGLSLANAHIEYRLLDVNKRDLAVILVELQEATVYPVRGVMA